MNVVRVPLASSVGVRFLNTCRSIVVHTCALPLVAMLSVSSGRNESAPCDGTMFVAICTSITQFESAFL